MASEATLAKQSARMEAARHPAEHRRYRELKKHIENAVEQLDRVLRRPRSSEVRRAYADLGRAIDRALTLVEGRVRLPYRGLIPPPTVHLHPFAATTWHRELEQLRDARERVRFAALDDPYYGIPAVALPPEPRQARTSRDSERASMTQPRPRATGWASISTLLSPGCRTAPARCLRLSRWAR